VPSTQPVWYARCFDLPDSSAASLDINMTAKLLDVLDSVIDEASFLRFLSALAADWEDERENEAISPSSPYGPGANGWENVTIGDFLYTAAAWGGTSPPLYTKPDNPWRRVADILHAGKIIE
jgi:hypothetical protein